MYTYEHHGRYESIYGLKHDTGFQVTAEEPQGLLPVICGLQSVLSMLMGMLICWDKMTEVFSGYSIDRVKQRGVFHHKLVHACLDYLLR